MEASEDLAAVYRYFPLLAKAGPCTHVKPPVRANSPPWSRRGGRAIKKGPVPLTARPGWFVQRREALLMNSVRYASICKEASRHLQTTPAAPAMVASRHLVDGRSHPSLTKQWHSFKEIGAFV